MFSLLPYYNFGGDIGQNELFPDYSALERRLFSPLQSEFRTDIIDQGDCYLLEAELPGFERDEIKVSVDGDYLSVNAERHQKYEGKNAERKYLHCERAFGSWTRGFNVSNVDTEKITVKYDDGLLKVILPKRGEASSSMRQLNIE